MPTFKNPHLLVLEAVWSPDNLGDPLTVRGFVSAWAEVNGVRVAFRYYNDRRDLEHWLREFLTAKGDPRICYIAGHGDGKRLRGLHERVHLAKLLAKVSKKAPRPKGPKGSKGLLLGSCEVGADPAELVRAGCGKISWAAGYRHEVSWMESMVSDLLFLEYLVGPGRCIAARKGFIVTDGEFRTRRTDRAELAAKWVCEDYGLAVTCGFSAKDETERRPTCGRSQQAGSSASSRNRERQG